MYEQLYSRYQLSNYTKSVDRTIYGFYTILVSYNIFMKHGTNRLRRNQVDNIKISKPFIKKNGLKKL